MSLKTTQRDAPPVDRYSSLEVRHFRLVYGVAEARGLTGASRRLRVTPSALSHQLRQIESIVGMPLFRRESKAMRLTAAGEIVFELATRAMGAVADVEERLQKLREGVSGTIRLCTHCCTGYHWLPAAMEFFRVVRPGADIRALESGSLVPVRLGRRGFRRTWRAIFWKDPEGLPLARRRRAVARRHAASDP